MPEIVARTEHDELQQDEEPWVDPHYFAPPRGDGPYWIYDHEYGSIYVIVHQDGHWHDCIGEGMENKEVIAGPLLLPPQEVLDRQAEHFETVRRAIEAEVGFDPTWDVGELMHHGRYFDTRFPIPPPVPEPPPEGKLKHRKKVPPAPKPPYVAPYQVIDGYYYVKLHPDWEPVFVTVREGYWAGMHETPFMWDFTYLTTHPIIVFGPFIRPSKDLVVHRTAATLLN